MTEPEEMTFTTIDAPPADTAPDRNAGKVDECEVCGKELVYSGKGRHPRFCADHKPGPAGSKSSGAGFRGRRKGLDGLQKQLSATFAMLGTTVSVVDKFDGFVIVSQADDLATALTNVADQNEKVRRALENMLTASAWSQVVMVGAAIAIPIAAHHGLLPTAMANAFVAEEQAPDVNNGVPTESATFDDVNAAA